MPSKTFIAVDLGAVERHGETIVSIGIEIAAGPVEATTCAAFKNLLKHN